MRTRGVVTAQLIALLVVALSAVPARSDFSITYPKGPDPAVSEWPSWPVPVTCDGLSFDPVAAFKGPTGAENGAGAPEQALRAYLDSGEAPLIPKRFWRLVSLSETRAVFAQGRLAQGPLWFVFQLDGGQWRPESLPGFCAPRSLRDARPATYWTLAPDQRLGRRTRRLRVNLHDNRCRGGRTLASLAEAPEFHQLGKRLVMTIWLEPFPGIHKCGPRRRREPELVVRLPGRRLGARRVYDGATYPPRLRQ
jgi:hypothetical protein